MGGPRRRHDPQQNIVPLRQLGKLFDPLYMQAHRLVDGVRRDELWRLIPVLRRAAQRVPGSAGLLSAVGEKIFAPPSGPKPSA